RATQRPCLLLLSPTMSPQTPSAGASPARRPFDARPARPGVGPFEPWLYPGADETEYQGARLVEVGQRERVALAVRRQPAQGPGPGRAVRQQVHRVERQREEGFGLVQPRQRR